MRGELAKTSSFRTESPVRSRDRAIAALAARQYGVVALDQLRILGLTASGVRSRVAAGRLHRLHQGVFAVGHLVVGGEGRWMAAVLACGAGAVLSHRSAAALWGIRPSARAIVEITTPRGTGRRKSGIQVHEAPHLATADITKRSGIPCTTVARTLLDLASVIDHQALEKAINEAEVLRLFDMRAVNEALARAGRRRGTAALSSTLTYLDPLQARTRSDLERQFLRICRQTGLPAPEVNAWLEIEGHRFQADFLWRRERLIVETDGYATHSTRRAFERDRRRDLLLLRAHYRTARVTWRQVIDEPHDVAESLRAVLRAP